MGRPALLYVCGLCASCRLLGYWSISLVKVRDKPRFIRSYVPSYNAIALRVCCAPVFRRFIVHCISYLLCWWFLPRCMECRRGLVMRISSVCPSVCQTRYLWQNERKLCLHSYTTWKNIYPSFVTRGMIGGGRLLLPEILGQPAPVGAKSPIFNRYSLLAPQP